MTDCKSSGLTRLIVGLVLFGIAFGYIEAAVVVYLRAVYQPVRERLNPEHGSGELFPLLRFEQLQSAGDQHIRQLQAELGREFATLVLLAGAALLTARNFNEWIALYIVAFGIWDIFYYVFLKLLIDWPASLLTWDVLFLIPATWTGPVVTPLILTMVMIIFAWFILSAAEKGKDTRIAPIEWLGLLGLGLLAGSGIVIIASMTDYLKHMLKTFAPGELLRAGDPRVMEAAQQYVPESLPWLLFAAGTLVILAPVIRFRIRV